MFSVRNLLWLYRTHNTDSTFQIFPRWSRKYFTSRLSEIKGKPDWQIARLGLTKQKIMINWLASSGWFFIICLFVFVFNSVGRLHILVRGSLEVSTYHCTVSECIVQWGATGQPITVKSPAEDNEQWSVSANEKSGLHNVHIGSGKMRMTTVSVPVEVRLVTFLSVRLEELRQELSHLQPADARLGGGGGEDKTKQRVSPHMISITGKTSLTPHSPNPPSQWKCS